MSGHDVVCDDCGFTSSGWPTKVSRDARATEHAAEHETNEAAPELAESAATERAFGGNVGSED
jgi:hypothetical protein